jgi:TRAP-type C4-dicarboxylate transport system permease large subunit
MIVFLILCGFCMSYVISYLGIAADIAEAIVASGLNRYVVMIIIYILWFIMGCLMDPSSMIILTVPFIFQTLTQLGFDPLWIGVVSTLSCEIGMITPPVGLNLFVLRSNTNLPMSTIIKGSLPYVIVLAIGLVILTVFPDIALWIPSLM